MKRILLTFTLLFIGLTSFAQLNLDWTKKWVVDSNGWGSSLGKHLELDTLVSRILDKNDNIGNYQLITHKFDDGDIINLYIFSDKEGYFLDLLYINKENVPIGYVSLYGIMINSLSKLDYISKRKLQDFKINYNKYEYMLFYDDDSTIEFTFEKLYVEGEEGKCRLYIEYVDPNKKISWICNDYNYNID